MAPTDTRAPEAGRRFLEPAPGRARADAELLARYRGGDESVREDVIERFLPLARQLARRYARGNEPLDDLFQVASVGLLKAIDRYDPARGYAFSTFAVPTIVGELKRYFRDTGWAVHVPRRMQELGRDAQRAIEQLTAERGQSPTLAEIAARLEVATEDLVEALEARTAYRPDSLDAPSATGESATPLARMGREDPGFARAEASVSVTDTVASRTVTDSPSAVAARTIASRFDSPLGIWKTSS